MLFQELLTQVDNAVIKQSDQLATTGFLQFPSNWCQGRTAFGGLSASMLYRAMRALVGNELIIKSLSTNFVGPLLADTDFHIEVEVLRRGKNSAQLLAKAIQNDGVQVIAQACFAKARASNVVVEKDVQLALSQPDETRLIPYMEGVTPQFFQHMAFNLQSGAMPFTDAKTSHIGGWMRLREPRDEMGVEDIILLTDAWPPVMLQMYQQVAPASSMSWYLEFVEQEMLSKDSWLAFDAKTRFAEDGYGLEDGSIFSESGKLLALTRQTVALFN